MFKKGNTKQFDNYSCPHNDKERAFTATLTHLELKEALMYDYRVTNVYRIWHYDQWSETIFRKYVQLLMKLKVESSDFPLGVATEQDKQKFAKEYMDKMGINIEIENVKFNPGLRFISVMIYFLSNLTF